MDFQRVTRLAVVIAFVFLSLCSRAGAVSGQWTFDQDPGLTVLHTGDDQRFSRKISQGRLQITMTREAATQRLYIPLSEIYGNDSTYRLRFRFRFMEGGLAHVLVGFFNSQQTNLALTDAHVCGLLENRLFVAGFTGSGYGRADPAIPIEPQRWYIWEMQGHPDDRSFKASLYDNEGLLLEHWEAPAGGLGEGIDVVGFGNYDSTSSDSWVSYEFDWFSWAVDDELPADPELQPEFEIAPVPGVSPGLVALWLFDEGPDGAHSWRIVDQSGNGNHGTLRPTEVLSDRPGYRPGGAFEYERNYCLDFSTSDSAAVEVPHSASLNLTGAFTIETWLRFQTTVGQQCLIAKQSGETDPSGYRLVWNGDTNQFSLLVGNREQQETVLSNPVNVSQERWYHLAVVFDPEGEDSQLVFFLDGQPSGTGRIEKDIAGNESSVWMGNLGGDALDASVQLDEMRISNRALLPSQLGCARPFGPGRLIFADGFEDYTGETDFWSRGGPYLNQWRRIDPTSGSVRFLRQGFGRSGQSAVDLTLSGDPSTPYNQAFLYYRFPLSMVEPIGRIGFEGWVAFDSLEDIRLFFLNEMFTGRFEPIEEHYGHTETLFAGGIQYNGRSRRWEYESLEGSSRYLPFSEPVEYTGGLHDFHYFCLVVDYDRKTYHSFQFNNRKWDLTGRPFLIFDPDYDHDPTPAMFEFNVRLISFDDYDAPYGARAIVDDVGVMDADIPLTGGWRSY